jgi:hypothetical protein
MYAISGQLFALAGRSEEPGGEGKRRFVDRSSNRGASRVETDQRRVAGAQLRLAPASIAARFRSPPRPPAGGLPSSERFTTPSYDRGVPCRPIPHERGFDALRALVGLQADLVDVVAAGGEGTHHLRQFARLPDVDRRLQRNRANTMNRGPTRQPSHPALRRPSTKWAWSSGRNHGTRLCTYILNAPGA